MLLLLLLPLPLVPVLILGVFGLVFFYLLHGKRKLFNQTAVHDPSPLVTDPEVRKKILKKGKRCDGSRWTAVRVVQSGGKRVFLHPSEGLQQTRVCCSLMARVKEAECKRAP